MYVFVYIMVGGGGGGRIDDKFVQSCKYYVFGVSYFSLNIYEMHEHMRTLDVDAFTSTICFLAVRNDASRISVWGDNPLTTNFRRRRS